MSGEAIAAVLASIGVVAGLLGTVLPALPGLPLVFLSILIYAAVTGFRVVTPAALGIMFVATLAGLALEYGLGLAAAKRRGASRAALWGALLGGIAGAALLGPVGVIAGPLVGAMAGELLNGQPFRRALEIGWITVVGMWIGILVELGIGLTMAVYFWTRVF